MSNTYKAFTVTVCGTNYDIAAKSEDDAKNASPKTFGAERSDYKTSEVDVVEKNITKPTVLRMSHNVQSGDWHDAPLKYIVLGGPEVQMFGNKKEAQRWISARSKASSFNEAYAIWSAVA